MSRWLKITAGVSAGGSFLTLALWYAIAFLPYLGEIKTISSRGNKVIKDIEHVIYPLAVAGETTQGLRSYAVRGAYWSLVHEQNPQGMLKWHTNNMLWLGASFIHFTDNEIFGLWVECVLPRCDGGLTSTAEKYFGRKISDLSERELAGLVALLKNPSRYAPGTESGETRTNEILKRVKTHNNAFNANSDQR
ncbi:MAG: transglycosylase domain-containing protein [Nitrospira sp.]|nr:transglycosylase domain-containing protein [Nitrospira sp.]